MKRFQRVTKSEQDSRREYLSRMDKKKVELAGSVIKGAKMATGRCSRLIEQSMAALAPIMSASAFHSHWPDMDEEQDASVLDWAAVSRGLCGVGPIGLDCLSYKRREKNGPGAHTKVWRFGCTTTL